MVSVPLAMHMAKHAPAVAVLHRLAHHASHAPAEIGELAVVRYAALREHVQPVAMLAEAFGRHLQRWLVQARAAFDGQDLSGLEEHPVDARAIRLAQARIPLPNSPTLCSSQATCSLANARTERCRRGGAHFRSVFLKQTSLAQNTHRLPLWLASCRKKSVGSRAQGMQGSSSVLHSSGHRHASPPQQHCAPSTTLPGPGRGALHRSTLARHDEWIVTRSVSVRDSSSYCAHTHAALLATHICGAYFDAARSPVTMRNSTGSHTTATRSGRAFVNIKVRKCMLVAAGGTAAARTWCGLTP